MNNDHETPETTDYNALSAAELRTLASNRGIAGASRMKKAAIIALLTDQDYEAQAEVAVIEAEDKALLIAEALNPTGGFDRAARDNLKATPVTLFDPAANLSDAQKRSRAALPRAERRHMVTRERTLNGVIQRVRNIPKALRRQGGMGSATKKDLANARIKTGTSPFSKDS